MQNLFKRAAWSARAKLMLKIGCADTDSLSI